MELIEASACLQNCTAASLVILDELGRGTSTRDGYALCFAILHHFATAVQCRTLLATHFHALADEPLLQGGRGVRFAHVASRITAQGAFVPLFRVHEGPSPLGSCGVRIAR